MGVASFADIGNQWGPLTRIYCDLYWHRLANDSGFNHLVQHGPPSALTPGPIFGTPNSLNCLHMIPWLTMM